ncbi:response regulator transcription factor [Collinsella sp. An268]|uniref:response regulator transcription factor n=1 Tax=Collinsella sp. An268 TaxID=1965612 RepID=UPI000B36D063|nr:response regulator transcription factor [Collinsella sp. An268]OUO63526.1 DNA-binding response regulator [Collinsella sp. An268]
MSARILLVEDDPAIVSALTELLRAEGYAVDIASAQDEALARALPGASGVATGRAPYDLVLLDVTLAQGNGLAVCGALKHAAPALPVIFLTASSDEFTTVTGLELGADDYIAKPFRPRELLARIAATLRRAQPPARRLLSLGELTIDPDRAQVTRAGAEIVLSALEYRLLLLFATHAGKLITREQIRDALWDDAGTYIEENTLTVYIKRLRDKIEDDPAHPALITTVRGLGYKALG